MWYQDARDGAGGVIFTEPYQFATSQVWSISTAAAVFDPVSGDFLGVASLDMHLDVIETPINYLTVVGGAGYAYMLAPGTNGKLARQKMSTSAVSVRLEEGCGVLNTNALMPRESERLYNAPVYSSRFVYEPQRVH